MKHIKFVITIIFLLFIPFSYTVAKSADNQTVVELRKQNELLMRANNQLQINYETQNQIIQGFNYRFSWLEILVGILSGVVGLISIALPIIIYFFQIKPAEKIINEVKDIDKTVELKLKEYLTKTENIRIENAINDLKSNDDRIKNNAINILSMSLTHNFSDEQLLTVYSVIKSNDVGNYKSVLLYILGSRESFLTEEYFSDKLKNDDKMYLDSLTTYHCIKYFCKTKINDHISKIVDYILNDEKEIYTKYTTIAWDMILCSTEAFILLINDNKLNTRIKDQITLSIIYTNIKGIVSKYNLEKEFNESLLAKASNFGFRS